MNAVIPEEEKQDITLQTRRNTEASNRNIDAVLYLLNACSGFLCIILLNE